MAHKTHFDIPIELLRKVAKFKDGKLYEFKSRVAQKDLRAIACWLVERSSVDFFNEKANLQWVNDVADVLMCDSDSLKRVLTSHQELGMRYECNHTIKWKVIVEVCNEQPMAIFMPIGISPFSEVKYKQFLQNYNINNVTTTKVYEVRELDTLDLNYVIMSLLDQDIPTWHVKDSVLENFNKLSQIEQLVIAKLFKCRQIAFEVIMSNSRQRKLELIGLIANHKIKEADSKDIVFAFENGGNSSEFISSKANTIIIIGTRIIRLSALQLAFYYQIAHNVPQTTADMVDDKFIESVNSIYVKVGGNNGETSRDWTRDDVNKVINSINKDLSNKGINKLFLTDTRGKRRYIPYFEAVTQKLHCKNVPQVVCLPLLP